MGLDKASSSSRSYSLVHVKPATITQFESSSIDIQSLFSKMRVSNEELALWLGRRASEIEPSDLAQRNAVITLALELYGVMTNQIIINELERLVALPKLADTDTNVQKTT